MSSMIGISGFQPVSPNLPLFCILSCQCTWGGGGGGGGGGGRGAIAPPLGTTDLDGQDWLCSIKSLCARKKLGTT